MIKNGPAERRKYLDYILCGTDKIYLQDLGRYNHCLLQRGRLLKDFGYGKKKTDELDVWDQQLAFYGMRIIRKRESFIGELQEIAESIHTQLTGKKEKLDLRYEPNVLADEFESRLKENRERDLRFGMNTVGPHRDDLAISANDMDLRTYGSQGQQRTGALSLKLAEIRIYENAKGSRPILLLDDVLSELDRERQNYLLHIIRDTQTFITCTGLDEFVMNHFEADHIFHVVRGGIE
jgi:DNA replication and repair protein RecF